MTARIFVLQTQDDIIDFRLGNRPANFLVRDFQSIAESVAYERGIDAIGDQYERLGDLAVAGNKVTYTRRLEDPEADAPGKAEARQVELKTAGEAEAYRQGLEDAEGFAAPLVIDDTDDRFEQLEAWAAQQ